MFSDAYALIPDLPALPPGTPVFVLADVGTVLKTRDDEVYVQLSSGTRVWVPLDEVEECPF
jgi:hypothetical protein